MTDHDQNGGVPSGDATTGDRSRTTTEARKIHPMVRWNRAPRSIGFFLIGLILLSLFYNSRNPLAWAVILSVALVWPQAAYYISRSSIDPVLAEWRNMCVESLFAGSIIVVIAFRPWPAAAMTIGLLVNTLASGGIRLTLRAALAYVVGMGLTVLVIGFSFVGVVSLATMLASILFMLLYASLVAFMSHAFMLGLRDNRRSLRKAHQDIADKLTLTRREVAQRERVEQKLRSAMIKAESANRAKSRFLATMSHEIRTPMNAIIGMTDLALKAKSDAEKDDYLTTVKKSTGHLLSVVNDILDYARLESGKLRLENIDFDLPDLVENVLKAMHFYVEKKDVDLRQEITGNVPPFVKGDSARLRQVLFNIIGNALKFTHHGRVTLKIERWTGEVTACPETVDACWLLFTVQDTGIGIPEDQLGAVFSSFHQVERDDCQRYEGTGLGLPICKQIVEQMGGRIWAERPAAGGSRFCFILPLRPGEEIDADKTIPFETWSQKSESRPLNLLLAEDNPINIRLTCVVLDNMGHQTTVAENGKEALDKLRSDAFDAVLMDLDMPGMDGFEATRRIRAGEAGENLARLPVVAMTAHVLNDIVDQCRQAGFTGCVSKPLDIDYLARVLQDVTHGGKGFEFSTIAN